MLELSFVEHETHWYPSRSRTKRRVSSQFLTRPNSSHVCLARQDAGNSLIKSNCRRRSRARSVNCQSACKICTPEHSELSVVDGGTRPLASFDRGSLTRARFAARASPKRRRAAFPYPFEPLLVLYRESGCECARKTRPMHALVEALKNSIGRSARPSRQAIQERRARPAMPRSVSCWVRLD